MPDQKQLPDYLCGQWAGPPPRHKIQTVGQLFGFLGTCPHAQTLEAYSSQFACTVWIALPCRQWSCRPCATQKIKELSIRTESAKPNRLLTLTVDPALWDNPRHAFDGTRRKVPEFMRYIRQRYKEAEYLRVTELTRNGWPHYHAMMRSPYIPHIVAKNKWKELTGALIVDLRQIKGSLNTYSYLVKYLSKMHKIGWTERHVSYSRNFFPKTDHPKKEGLELDAQTIIEAHPSTYLFARFRGANLTQLGHNLFALDPKPSAVEELEAPDSWDAPDPPREPSPTSPGNTLSGSDDQKVLFPNGPQLEHP